MTGRTNREERFEQLNPLARPLSSTATAATTTHGFGSTAVGSEGAAGGTTMTTNVGRLPPPLPPSLRNSFAYSTSTYTHQPSRLSQSTAAARRPSLLAAAAVTSTAMAEGRVGAAAASASTTITTAEARRASIAAIDL